MSGSTPAGRNGAGFDRNAFALILFNKLHRELTSGEEELTRSRAARMIQEALDLLPGVYITTTDKPNIILLHVGSTQSTKQYEMNIQDAIDSLMVVWEDYRSIAGLDHQPGSS